MSGSSIKQCRVVAQRVALQGFFLALAAAGVRVKRRGKFLTHRAVLKKVAEASQPPSAVPFVFSFPTKQ